MTTGRISLRGVVITGLALLGLMLVGPWLLRHGPPSGARSAPSPQLPIYGRVGEFVLTNQSGLRFASDELRGRVWLADIIFTRCPGPCVTMSALMSDLRKTFAAEHRVQFISLTADPEHDTPAVLSAYGKRFGAAVDRWQFLTGPKSEVYRLAVDGLKLTALEPDPDQRASDEDLFIHSLTFVVVDAEGQVRGVFDSGEESAAGQIEACVRTLLRSK
jgi:protein SCO1/2